MPYLRFKIDLAIKQPVSSSLTSNLPAIKQKIRDLKTYATKINVGEDNEEDTVSAKYHICNHDIGKPCGKEYDI